MIIAELSTSMPKNQAKKYFSMMNVVDAKIFNEGELSSPQALFSLNSISYTLIPNVNSCCYDILSEPDSFTQHIEIKELINFNLKKPLNISIVKDGDGYLASLEDFALYGYSENKSGAIEMLKWEIEDTYNDIKEDINITREWELFREKIKGLLIINA